MEILVPDHLVTEKVTTSLETSCTNRGAGALSLILLQSQEAVTSWVLLEY